MVQLLQHALRDPTDRTCFTLIYAARSEEDLVLLPELEEIRRYCPSRLRIRYIAEKLEKNQHHLGVKSTSWQGGIGLVTLKDIVDGARWPAPHGQDKSEHADKQASLVVVCGS